jgi:hypothetical protein
MRRYHFIFLFLFFSSIIIGAACNSKKNTAPAENDIDAARNFIRAALDGKFDEARIYMLADSININFMDVAERSYAKADTETKNGYRAASINMHKVTAVNDSTTIVIYSNSFKNDHDTLKVVKENSQWLIDLKYLYQHDQENILITKPAIDSSK